MIKITTASDILKTINEKKEIEKIKFEKENQKYQKYEKDKELKLLTKVDALCEYIVKIIQNAVETDDRHTIYFSKDWCQYDDFKLPEGLEEAYKLFFTSDRYSDFNNAVISKLTENGFYIKSYWNRNSFSTDFCPPHEKSTYISIEPIK